ncbi:hypothetical protein [Levilactobacillus spicheri]|uniref:Uncharacterized protein n=2 Tax=Levilactobacillus spicheri TaxID=216463 RepID=A0A0F3RS20_9LACO|nr:hypothetical protein [Levilactobacillus spicheri]KJW12399.1 hypothetical protein VC81_07775 [Levilactobacillus spicheri]GEO68055.1 hypothetical protein LSP04_24740 [Levilactobacillus spicheri]
MRFDWRYAFHSFWFLMTYLILSSTAVFFNDQGHSLRMALGTIVALIVVDVLFTRNYPYFNRVDRQGATILVSIAMFALVALLAANFDPTWPSIVWDFTGFCLASIGGTIDGYLVRPTELKPAQTRRELIRRERLLKKITH